MNIKVQEGLSRERQEITFYQLTPAYRSNIYSKRVLATPKDHGQEPIKLHRLIFKQHVCAVVHFIEFLFTGAAYQFEDASKVGGSRSVPSKVVVTWEDGTSRNQIKFSHVPSEAIRENRSMDVIFLIKISTKRWNAKVTSTIWDPMGHLPPSPVKTTLVVHLVRSFYVVLRTRKLRCASRLT